jgi:subtilisin family serine protease
VRLSLQDAPFAEKTGRGVVVAVLDSGVHASHPHVGDALIGRSFADTASASDFVDRIGHGTAVAAAIREKAPGAEILAVKIFDRQLATNVNVLADAIVWSADAGARLINLSLGTANYANADRLADAVQHARTRGALVVSARESNEVSWLPGSLPGVVGVVADTACERNEVEITMRAGDVPLFSASPYPRPIPGVPPERNLRGVSFAVANVTGFLARALEDGSTAP